MGHVGRVFSKNSSGDIPGEVRFKENPQAKTSDIRAAIEFVSTLAEADAERINGLGICASSGYMVDAVAGSPLVDRVGRVCCSASNRHADQHV